MNGTEFIPLEGNQTYPDWADDWVAPLEIRKWFPYYVTGHDRDGSPVYVLEFGRWKFAEALANGKGGPAKVKQVVWKAFKQGMYQMQRDAKANNNQGMVALFDWDGLTVANYADRAAVELLLRMFSALNTINKALNYVIMINSKSEHELNSEKQISTAKFIFQD